MASVDADCSYSPPKNNDLTSYCVVFQDFSERVPIHGHTISFSYQTLSQSVPQYGDWIGLFKGGRTNPEKNCDYISYVGAKDGSICLKNSSYKVSLPLSHDEELDVCAFYQLIYVTMDCSILGCSQRFYIRDGFCIVKDTSLSAVSTPACKSSQHNSNCLDTCSNDSSDSSCNISQNSSSECLQIPHIESRDFAAHGRLAFHDLSEWLAFMSNASRQKKKQPRAPAKVTDELWHTDPKVIVCRKYNEWSDYTKAGNISSIDFSMGKKNSENMSESRKNFDYCDNTEDSELRLKSDAEGDKANGDAQTLLLGTKDCMGCVSPTSKDKSRQLVVSDDGKEEPTGETRSEDQIVCKSSSAELILLEKLQAPSSSSSVEVFMEAVHVEDAFNSLYLKLDESEGKLKSLAEELRMSTVIIEAQENEIKQYKTMLTFEAEERNRQAETTQSQALMLVQYQEKIETQSNELKDLKERTESSICELKEEKKENKLLTKELEEVNGRIKLQSSELDIRCIELCSFKALVDSLSKELNEVREQELTRSSEMLLLKEKLETESSNLKLLKDRDVLESAELQCLRMEVEAKSAELELIKDSDKSKSAELKLLQDHLCTRSEELGSVKATVESQSLELMQLNTQIAALTVQLETDRTELVQRRMELEAREKEIKQSKQKEELLSMEIDQCQTNRESLLAEIKLREDKEKQMQDELKDISDALHLCRAEEMQLRKDLDECRIKEETMLTELTQLRAEKELVSDEIDQLKATNEFLLRELHLSKSSNELLLEDFKKYKTTQQQTLSAYSRARINAELLSRELEKLRSKEECVSDEVKKSNESLKAMSDDLMLSRKREENLLEELAQLGASGKALLSALQECRTREEALLERFWQQKVIDSSLSSEPHQSMESGKSISKEMNQMTDVKELLAIEDSKELLAIEDSKELLAIELEHSKAIEVELRSQMHQSKLQVEALADEFQQSLESLKLILEELKMTRNSQKSLASELQKSKVMNLQKQDSERIELAADQAKSLVSQVLISSKTKPSQMSKDALIIELEQSKAIERRLHNSLLESKVKQDAFMAEIMQARTKSIRDKKQLVTRSEVLVRDLECTVNEEDKSVNFKLLIENEKRLSTELSQCKINEELLLSELKQFKANEELMSAELNKYKTTEDLLSAKLKEFKASEKLLSIELKQFKANEEIMSAQLELCKTNEELLSAELKECKAAKSRISAEVMELKADLQKSKINEEILSAKLTEYKAKEEMLLADLKKSKTNEELLLAELKQSKASEERLSSQSRNGEEVSASPKSKADYKLSHLANAEQLQKRIAAQSEEILHYREKIQMLLYKNLMLVTQNWSVCEDLTQTGIKLETLESLLAHSEVPRKGSQKADILYVQLRKEQEFRENLFALHDLKNRELFRQIAVLNSLVITSQQQMETIFQRWREPAKNTKTEDTSKLVQENDLAQNIMNHCCLPSRLWKFRSDNSDKAYIHSDQNQEGKNPDCKSKGHDGAETRMIGKLDYRQSRSVDFHKCTTSNRKENKLSATFNSRVMNNVEASLKKLDMCHRSCEDKQDQVHLSKSVAFNGAETNYESISADDEIVPSVEALESSCKVNRRGGQKCPSLSSSPKTLLPQKFSGLKGKKAAHDDKSKVQCPDQLFSSVTSQLGQKECSQHCPNDLFFSEKLATPSYPKTNKLRPDVPSKSTSKHPQSPSKIPMATDSKFYNRFVNKVAITQEPHTQGLNTACCSTVQQPTSSALNDCDSNSQCKRAYSTLKHLKENMSYFLDSMVEVYPEKISLDLLDYSSAHNLAQDKGFSSHLQASNKTSLCHNDLDFQQRNEILSDCFPISSEIFSLLTSQFVENLTGGHSEILDKCNSGIGPNCESKASARQLTALMFPIDQSVESSGNLYAGRKVSSACRSIPESNQNTMSSSVSFFSDSVEPSVRESKGNITPRAQNKKYPGQNDSKLNSRPISVSKQKSESDGQKRPWCSSSKSQTLGHRGDTISGRKGGIGYTCSPLQKEMISMSTEQLQANTDSKCKNPRRLAPKPLLLKPIRGKGGYAAMAKKVASTADGKSQNFQMSTQLILPMKPCKENVETVSKWKRKNSGQR